MRSKLVSLIRNIPVKPIMLLSLLLSVLTACGIYSTGFNCPDSKGARCVMLSEIDRRVDNGEIENVYVDKKCQGKNCQQKIVNVPKKAVNQTHKVWLKQAEEKADIEQEQVGDDLYLK